MQCWMLNPSSSFRERSLIPVERMCWESSSRREAAVRSVEGERDAVGGRLVALVWWVVKWVWIREVIDSVGSIVLIDCIALLPLPLLL